MNQRFKFGIAAAALGLGLALFQVAGLAHEDGFNAAVKTIEQFYHVKHAGIPLLARAGIKAAKTAARIKGAEYRRLADAGSVRIAYFDDQTFNSRGRIADFKAMINTTLNGEWSPLVQTLAAKDEEQSYVYLRDTGDRFHLLVITIEQREGTVVEATVSPKTLAMLLRDPEDLGRAITDDATINDN